MLLEFGENLHKGRTPLAKEFPEGLERLAARLPMYLISLLGGQYRCFADLDAYIDGIEKQLSVVAKQNEICQRLLEIPGIVSLIATAAVATMGEASVFKSGREFAVFIGLVPKQTGSGGKAHLLGISKRGDTYLQTLFIHGINSASLVAKDPGLWITELKRRRPKVVANKLA